MRGFSVSILLALLLEAHAELKVGRPNDADLDDTTLGVLGKLGYQQSIRIPQQRVNSFPYKPIQTPEQRPHPLPFQHGYHSDSSMIPRASEESAEAPAEEPPAAPAPAPVPEPSPNSNVFGGKLEDCGPEVCSFSGESPKMCVGVAPRIRPFEESSWLMASEARSFELEKPKSQMMWSDNNIPQCIPLWSWAEETGNNFMAWLTYGNSDVIPKCNALPSAMLASQYTMDTYSTCEYEARQYKYVSPSSPKWTSDSSVTTKNDPFFIPKESLGQQPVPKMSTKCERFREVIDGICNICAVQGTSTATLTSQCEKLQATAPPVADTRAGKWLPFKVFKRGMPWNMGKALFTQNISSVPAAVLMGLLMTSAVIVAMHRRRASTEAQEPLLPTIS